MNWRTFDPTGVDGGALLGVELIAYKDHLPELLKHKGEYVLIKGTAIIDLFPTLEAALESAAERFGAEPALIKQVVERESIQPIGGLTF